MPKCHRAPSASPKVCGWAVPKPPGVTWDASSIPERVGETYHSPPLASYMRSQKYGPPVGVTLVEPPGCVVVRLPVPASTESHQTVDALSVSWRASNVAGVPTTGMGGWPVAPTVVLSTSFWLL